MSCCHMYSMLAEAVLIVWKGGHSCRRRLVRYSSRLLDIFQGQISSSPVKFPSQIHIRVLVYTPRNYTRPCISGPAPHDIPVPTTNIIPPTTHPANHQLHINPDVSLSTPVGPQQRSSRRLSLSIFFPNCMPRVVASTLSFANTCPR
jgi:hypothetical protein